MPQLLNINEYDAVHADALAHLKSALTDVKRLRFSVYDAGKVLRAMTMIETTINLVEGAEREQRLGS